MKALVIGGTKGFGKEISENLIRKGFELITVSRGKEGYKGYPHYRYDLGNLRLWEETINRIIKDAKHLDFIFFVFGFVNPKKFKDLNIKNWIEAFSKNVVYIAIALQKLERPILKNNMKIVTIGSQWSYKVGHEYLVPYTISKHSLVTLVEDFAQRNKKIIINNFCVPTMDTPGYYKVRKSFEKIGKKKLIDNLSEGIVADHKKIGKEVVELTLRNNKSGISFIISPNGKINRL